MTIVKIFHNIARDEKGRADTYDGYKPGHPLVLVFQTEFEGTANQALNHVYELLNIGHEPEFRNPPDKRAIEYRYRGNRSLSVGDVAQVGDRWFACAGVGWEPIREPKPTSLQQVAVYGTTPLDRRPNPANVLTLGDAEALAAILRMAQGNMPVRWLNKQHHEKFGVAQRICGPLGMLWPNYADVRRACLHVKVTDGTESKLDQWRDEYWPISELIKDYTAHLVMESSTAPEISEPDDEAGNACCEDYCGLHVDHSGPCRRR